MTDQAGVPCTYVASSPSAPALESYELLSDMAHAIWGKTGDDGETWMPLCLHMTDSLHVARHLWSEWASEGMKHAIACSLGDESLAEALYCFVAGVHDIGKATPVFQSKSIDASSGLAWMDEHVGLRIPTMVIGHRTPTHPIAGAVIVEDFLHEKGWSSSRCISMVIAAHHGTYPTQERIIKAHDASMELYGVPGSPWRDAQRELLEYAFAASGLDEYVLDDLWLPLPAASLLTGLVIMTDWIASGYPLVSIYDDLDADGIADRERTAWQHVRIAPAWHEPDLHVTSDTYRQFFASRFALPEVAVPRPIQSAATRIAIETHDPGLMVIEAPMGEGKTEAALSAAEILAGRQGYGGVCVALPTMATADGMFGRVESWLEHLPHGEGLPEKSLYLAHGKAMLNEQFRGIVESSDRPEMSRSSDDVIVSEWMCGRKRGMLSNFVVCTVDQVLMGALDMKHLSLRQVALQKVIVIDEVHAYDAYMRQYLCTLLGWLGFWHVPTIMLSATLPLRQRKQFFDAYLAGRKATTHGNVEDVEDGNRKVARVHIPAWKRRVAMSAASNDNHAARGERHDGIDANAISAYPIITYTDGIERKSLLTKPCGRKTEVRLRLIDDSIGMLKALLADSLCDGGCAGVICDTVTRAQEVEYALRDAFDDCDVLLDHSRYMDIDRMDIEQRLRVALGPSATIANGHRPRRCIVIGTQVLEQSLDIDFDLLVTDIAPIDLIFQRLGRLHRHNRGEHESDRPSPLRTAVCYVRGIHEWKDVPKFAHGINRIYDEATLIEAMTVLQLDQPNTETMRALPSDIAQVRVAYEPSLVNSMVPQAWRKLYASACKHRDETLDTQISRASACRIMDIARVGVNLDDWDLTEMTHACHPLDDSRGSMHDSDMGIRAVRDTQETIEVLLVRKTSSGIALLPWVGNEQIPCGADIVTSCEPSAMMSQLIRQCAVRLPLAACPPQRIDECIDELEKKCYIYVSAWQQSRWLSGQLLLALSEEDDGTFMTSLLGKTLCYSREQGLSVVNPL